MRYISMDFNAKHIFAGLFLALVVAGAVMIIAPEAEKGEEIDGEAGAWLSLKEVKEANYGKNNVVWVNIEGNVDGRAHIIVYNTPPPRKIVLLEGKWAGANNFNEFGGVLQEKTRVTGWGFETKNIQELTPAQEGRMIILPSGAWPSELESEWGERIGENDVLLYMGVKQNISLDKYGGVREGNVLKEVVEGGEEIGNDIEETEFQGVRIWVVGHTLDEFADIELFVDNILIEMENSGGRGKVGENWHEIKEGMKDIVFVKGEGTEKWMRVSVRGEEGELVRLWDVKAEQNLGVIEGPESVVPSAPASFQIRIWPDYLQEEEIEYKAVTYSGEGEKFSEIVVGGGSIVSGKGSGGKIAWVGSFVQSEWPGTEYGIIEIEDQFGRVYARAVVKMPKYELIAPEKEGFERKYVILKDGDGIKETKILIKKEGGKWAEFIVHGGVVVVASEWEEGENKIYFKLKETVLTHSWVEWEGGRWLVFAEWGLPGILLVGIVYLVLRPGKKSVFRIVVPEFVQLKQGRIEVSRKELLRIAKKAMRSSEIMEKLLEIKKVGKNIAISQESLESALGILVKEGKLLHYEEYYAPAKGNSLEGLRGAVMAMHLKDGLIERGIRIMRKKEKGVFKDGRGREWIVWNKGRWGKLLKKNAKMPDFIVFENEKQMQKFEEELSEKGGVGAGRVKLAKINDKLVLATIDKVGEVCIAGK
ncbi:MAG: hypothetical protein ABIH83_03780 [Candidatus Micrarchaeota archaeon]